jgi:hypothetical protein
MPSPGSLPRIIQLQDGSYATPDGNGGWAPYTGALPGGESAAPEKPAWKVGDSDAISHAWDVVDSITASKDLAGKPLATGTASQAITGIPVIGGVVGQNRANLQTKMGQIAGDLRQLGIRQLYEQTGKKGVGSIARNQSEQQALQASLAAIGAVDAGQHGSSQQPDAATVRQGLDNAERIYHRHLARLYGLDPDSPDTEQTLAAAAANPNLRNQLLEQARVAAGGTPPDHGVTTTGAPPLTDAPAGVAPSGTAQVEISPELQRVKPQLEGMLNAPRDKVSNGQILQFLKDNGVNPATTNILPLLDMRNSGKYHGFTVDPRISKPLTGVRKFMAGVGSFSPGGVPVGATLAGAGDVASLGAAPDVAGLIHGATGAGPSRSEVVNARDVSAEANPGATFAGNMAGALLSPIKGGGIGRTAATSAAYGALASDDPSLQGRLSSALVSGVTGAAVHGAAKGVLGLGTQGYRGVRGAVGGEAGADANAIAHAADAMPVQDVNAVTANVDALRAAGAKPPAAAGLSRAGQEFLSRVASSSPTARAAADEAAAALRQNMPADLAQSFDQAIADVAPKGGADASKFLNRPTREITADVQDLASREYEAGIKPIANEPVTVTPELADTLGHERILPAIRDALSNHQLDDATRAALRGLPAQLKAMGSFGATIKGAGAATLKQARDKYAAGIPMTVDSARNIATALDRTAAKLQEGSEGAVEMRTVAKEIRNTIGEQYPEYAPVNARYADRQRAINAVEEARSNFLGETPEQIDALAKSSRKFTNKPGAPEFGVEGASPLPSNRQFAIAGAREAATTKAGAGTGTGAPGLARQLAEGPNQQGRNKMVLGSAVPKFAKNVAAKATVADAVDRVTATTGGDQTEKLWKLAKRAVATKLTGGVSHYVVGSAIASIPNMTGQDAARVTRIFLDADNADQAVRALTKSYGAARARTILASIAGRAAAPTYTRTTPDLKSTAVGSPVGP